MKIKTASGYEEAPKSSTRRIFLEAYIATGAFTGTYTLRRARRMWNQIANRHPRMTAKDCGTVVGLCFKHKPNEDFLTALTGHGPYNRQDTP